MPAAQPSCFISYSWDSAAHRDWVRRLATRLRQNGVDAVLDAFHAPLGADLAAFMGRIAICDHVLVVCTPGFCAKAGRAAGGVGYEQAIITGQIFAGAARPEKFIPLLREGAPQEAVPPYLLGRHAADFRDDADFEASLQSLLRALHGVPVHPVPPIGPPPQFAAAADEGPIAWRRLVHESFDLDDDAPGAVDRYAAVWVLGADGPWQGSVRDGVHRIENLRDPDAVTYGYLGMSSGDPPQPLDLGDARVEVAVRVVARHGGPLAGAGLLMRFDRARRHYAGLVLAQSGAAGQAGSTSLQFVRRDDAGFALAPLALPPWWQRTNRDGWVQLSIEGRGRMLAVGVDGRPWREIAAPAGLGGDPGWIAIGAGAFEFDDFVVAERA
ncbi:MAG: toll/interleukin-1 receptor domain-containing protein [Burkholderiales bacterium]|nr:toll/interleukin-1 receptor domain-containing protein [Burkholderiales bacterium]